MSISTRYVFIASMDVTPEAEPLFNEVYDTEHVPNLLVVEKHEAERFACNAVVIGKRVITNTGCPRLHNDLLQRGYTPHETPLSEFVKAGGSAKCLTLRLDGEDAAAWKTNAA